MPSYLSPGVYVEEVPSAVKAIAGVGTSTAGFIGVFATDPLTVPLESVVDRTIGTGDGADTTFTDAQPRTVLTSGSFQVKVNGAPVAATLAQAAGVLTATLAAAPATGTRVSIDYAIVTTFVPLAAGEVRLCTNFTEYKNFFGDFSTDPGHRHLTHAVFGFFN